MADKIMAGSMALLEVVDAKKLLKALNVDEVEHRNQQGRKSTAADGVLFRYEQAEGGGLDVFVPNGNVIPRQTAEMLRKVVTAVLKDKPEALARFDSAGIIENPMLQEHAAETFRR